MEEVQAAMSAAITRETLNFEAGMSSALINVTFQKQAEMQADLARNAGLAAEGIGKNLNITV